MEGRAYGCLSAAPFGKMFSHMTGLRTSLNPRLIFALLCPQGGCDGEREEGEDDGERGEGRDVDPVGGEHLERGEAEDGGDAVVQKAQAGERADQDEVEGAQADDGHDVGGVSEEWIAGNGEDSGDGVEGEDDVGDLDGDEGQQEHGDDGAAAAEDDKSVLTGADGMQAGEPGDPAGRCVGLVGLGGDDEADGGDEKDGGEDVGDGGEAGEQGKAAGDEESAHEEGSGYSPEEDFRLVGVVDADEAEEQEEDEEVVYGEGLLESIGGEVLDGGRAAEGVVKKQPEGERGSEPAGCGDDGGAFGGGSSAQRGLVGGAARVGEFGGEQGEEREVEADPFA